MNVKAKTSYVFGDEQWIVKGSIYIVDEVIKAPIAGYDAYIIDGQMYGTELFEVVD
jgi:hypothetical protein